MLLIIRQKKRGLKKSPPAINLSLEEESD